jgi:hypothetical protein
MPISGAIMVNDGTMNQVIGIWEDIEKNDRFVFCRNGSDINCSISWLVYYK